MHKIVFICFFIVLAVTEFKCESQKQEFVNRRSIVDFEKHIDKVEFDFKDDILWTIRMINLRRRMKILLTKLRQRNYFYRFKF